MSYNVRVFGSTTMIFSRARGQGIMTQIFTVAFKVNYSVKSAYFITAADDSIIHCIFSN
jgi:hypothetical protein